MMNNTNSFLARFYFGAVSDEERLQVERALLLDQAMLTEFLDLKRKIESAEMIPTGPSHGVWYSIRSKIETKKKFFIPLTFGVALASLIAFLFFIRTNSSTLSNNDDIETRGKLIFDSSSQLPASSNVL